MFIFFRFSDLLLGEDPYKSGRTLSERTGSILDLRFSPSSRKRFDAAISTVDERWHSLLRKSGRNDLEDTRPSPQPLRNLNNYGH